jgi:hypothetical protein
MLRKFKPRYLSALALIIAVQIFCLCIGPRSEARDLTEVFTAGYNFSALGNDPAAVAAVAPAIAAAVSQAVTQEFPSASVAPAFTYRYNPTLSIFERSTGVPGPLFSERALTLGEGQLNLGVGYSHIDFSDLNGTSLDNIRSPALLNAIFDEEKVKTNFNFRGDPVFLAPSSGSVLRTRLDLQAHVMVPTLRYGLSERWDVSLSIPIVNTFLRVRNEAVPVVDVNPAAARAAITLDERGKLKDFLGFVNPVSLTPVNPPFVKSQRSSKLLARAAGSATGVGDIALRTKYHLWRTEAGGAALGLNLQLPSGEVRDFHGTDETHLSTFVYLSQVVGERFEPHLNLGVDFNADDVDRSSFLYAVGTTLLVGKNLGLMVDFIGRSEFGRFPVRFPSEAIYHGAALDRAPATCTAAQPCFLDPSKGDPKLKGTPFEGTIPFPFFPERIKRNDIADFSFGLRYALGTSGSVFFGGIIPLNGDGLRADFIPSGGVEYTF